MKRSETQSEILKALANFHKNIIQPKKDANNPFFKSKYVPLENVTDVIDKVAPEYGLAYAQEALTDADKGMVGVATLLTHDSGEWIEFEPLFLKADKQTAQGYGSAITYARRYSLSSAFGIASETDDDGNETTQQTQKHQQEDLKNRIQSGYDFLKKIGIDKEIAEKEILKRTNKRKIETLTDQEHIDLLLEVSKAEREKIED